MEYKEIYILWQKKKNINFDKLWLFISWILLATLKLNLKIQKAFSFLKIYI